jgi:hypothetical protein
VGDNLDIPAVLLGILISQHVWLWAKLWSQQKLPRDPQECLTCKYLLKYRYVITGWTLEGFNIKERQEIGTPEH